MSKDMATEYQDERIRGQRNAEAAQSIEWYKDLYEYFAPVRAEIIARGIGADEVNADIDAALQEVRRRRN